MKIDNSPLSWTYPQPGTFMHETHWFKLMYERGLELTEINKLK